MSYLCIKVPNEASKLLSSLEVSGIKTDTSELHITVLYFSKESTIKEVSKIFEVAYEIIHGMKPFKIKTSQVDFFNNSDANYPIIAKVDCPELVELNTKLKEAFDKNDINYAKNFKDFKPHITLSYSEDKPQKYKFDEVSFTVTEIELAGGSAENDTVFVTFPLKNLKKESRLLLKIDMFQKLAFNSMN